MSSTNEYCKDLISKTTPIDGTVIVTDEQIKGKGQGKNTWQTQNGKNLTFSIIYHTSFLEAQNQFYLSMAVSNGIYKAMSTFIDSENLSIKWPNDIIYNHKKLGGILIENSILGKHLKYSIVGIGTNINQQFFPNLPHATSLALINSKKHDLNTTLNTLCTAIESEFLKLKSGHFKTILEVYNQNLYKLNKPFSFKLKDKKLQGKILGVEPSGLLKVWQNNELIKFNFGAIKWQYGA